MSDSEDDYMSDKLIQSCTEDIRPGLVFNRTLKRQYELEKKKAETQAKRPKNSKEQEEELREKGLNTALSSDNKGFQMLAKMGFKQGEGLGKSKSGRTEPIKIEFKNSKTGIGVESQIKEQIKKKIVKKDANLKEKLDEFQAGIRLKQVVRFLHKDFMTAQRTCENLDSSKGIEEPIREYFWTRETMRKKQDIQDEEEELEFDDKFNAYLTEENLLEIIDYLRHAHLYCMFCAFVATDEEDLLTNCPGPYRSDHDDG